MLPVPAQIVANFGDRPFQADVEAMKAEARQRMQASIAHVELPCRGKVCAGHSFSQCPGFDWRFCPLHAVRLTVKG